MTKRALFTFEFDMTDEYFENQIVPFGEMLESGEFYKKFTEGIESKLQIVNAKLEISDKNSQNNEQQ